MKVVVALVTVLSLCGCATPRMTVDGRPVENTALRAMAHNTRTPELGKVYIHKGGRDMKVIQALDGGVLVHPVVGEAELEWRGVNAVNEKMTIYIETPMAYVDDEYLRAGLYEFVGRYEYKTVEDARKTVRKFREVREAQTTN